MEDKELDLEPIATDYSYLFWAYRKYVRWELLMDRDDSILNFTEWRYQSNEGIRIN